jgi:hypothetical protein
MSAMPIRTKACCGKTAVVCPLTTDVRARTGEAVTLALQLSSQTECSTTDIHLNTRSSQQTHATSRVFLSTCGYLTATRTNDLPYVCSRLEFTSSLRTLPSACTIVNAIELKHGDAQAVTGLDHLVGSRGNRRYLDNRTWLASASDIPLITTSTFQSRSHTCCLPKTRASSGHGGKRTCVQALRVHALQRRRGNLDLDFDQSDSNLLGQRVLNTGCLTALPFASSA